MRAWWESIRYEDGAWPLWDLGRDVRYLLKSVLHRPGATAPGDEEWRARSHVELARLGGSGRTPGTGPHDTRLKVLGVGDLMWIRDNWDGFLGRRLRELLARADLLVGNLETPVDPQSPVPRYRYESLTYNAPREFLGFMRLPGRAVLSICNNHSLDRGERGLERTRAMVSELGTPVGGVEAGTHLARVDVRGVHFGFLAFTFGVNRSRAQVAGLPVLHLAGEEVDWRRLRRWVATLRAAGAQIIVAIPHWGYEYEYYPGATQRHHARRLIAEGVDWILGSSPHVLQPAEVVSIDGWDGALPCQVRRHGPPRVGLIAYSLGNLSTVMPTLACSTGAVLELDLVVGGDGSTRLERLAAHPVLSRKNLKKSVLGAETVLVDPRRSRREASAHRHARRVLGPIVCGGP